MYVRQDYPVSVYDHIVVNGHFKRNVKMSICLVEILPIKKQISMKIKSYSFNCIPLPVLIHIHTNMDVKQAVDSRGGQVEAFTEERLYTIFLWHHSGTGLR